MNDILTLTLCWAAGAVMGGLFFGGLRWTTRRLPRSGHPAALALGSFAVRLGTVVAGFGLLTRFGWQGPAIGLVGFVLVRIAIVRWVMSTGRASQRLES